MEITLTVWNYIVFKGENKKISLLDMVEVRENYGWSFQSALWNALKSADQENIVKILTNRKEMILRDYQNGLYDEYLKEC